MNPPRRLMSPIDASSLLSRSCPVASLIGHIILCPLLIGRLIHTFRHKLREQYLHVPRYLPMRCQLSGWQRRTAVASLAHCEHRHIILLNARLIPILMMVASPHRSIDPYLQAQTPDNDSEKSVQSPCMVFAFSNTRRTLSAGVC